MVCYQIKFKFFFFYHLVYKQVNVVLYDLRELVLTAQKDVNPEYVCIYPTH